jgi:hypothetical protein
MRRPDARRASPSPRPIRTSRAALAFLKTHGVVLQAAKGRVPTLTEAIAGAPIRGSWWGHPLGKTIFRVLTGVCESSDVLICRLVDGKITFVHRRLWPALVRLASRFPREGLAAVAEEHTPSGAHRSITTPFPRWVPPDVREAAERLSEREAEEALAAVW